MTTTTLQAGRALDAEVAHRVLGWPVTGTEYTPWNDTTTITHLRKPDEMGDVGQLRGHVVYAVHSGIALPPVSADIAAAWQVVGRIHGDADLYTRFDDILRRLMAEYTGTSLHEFEASLAALLICRAALAAVGA